MGSAARAFLLSAAVALGGTVACGSYVKRGSALYADGRYIEAAEVFERTEHRLSKSSPREQASYGLYRGLTLLVLGDYAAAHRWLAFAYDVERANPGALRGDRRQLLDRGWYELGERMKATPPQGPVPSQPGTAVATSPSPDGARPPPPDTAPERKPREDRTLVPR